MGGQEAISTRSAFLLANPGYRLLSDAERGSLASFRSTFGIDHELLIPHHAHLPLFKIEFLVEPGKFATVTSSEARDVGVSRRGGARLRMGA